MKLIRKLIATSCMLILTSQAALAEVLIVADEFPAMQSLAAQLKSVEHIESKIVWQTNLPPALIPFQAVAVYIHRDLFPSTEAALIRYTESGGKLVVLHHSISSGKRKNQRWFQFLGVSLPAGEVGDGGYKWIEGVTWSLVNLNPSHFIMTNRVAYPNRIPYASTNATIQGETLPGITLDESEVYLNHVHTAPHTLLMGLSYKDDKTGVTYMQDRAGWVKPAGRGWIVYLMAGHSRRDFENPAYGRIVLNALIWHPPSASPHLL